MEKVCQNWSKEAFDDKLVNASYWDEFAQNAKDGIGGDYSCSEYGVGGEGTAADIR